ncbi:hypothetical protein Tco_0932169 [Tanacetum coccineum]
MANLQSSQQEPQTPPTNPAQSSLESSQTPIPFEPSKIIININNEVANLYPKHKNDKYFEPISDFISKYCLYKAFTLTPSYQYHEYLVEFWYTAEVDNKSKRVWFSFPMDATKGEVGLISFKKAIRANYIASSKD